MKSFQKKFKEEVKEYFERLESGLLQLGQDPENYQVIDEIFRLMHSIKGSGGMFGFDLLSDVTHELESLFEIFRSKRGSINSEVISFTLKSIDVLDNLLTQDPTEAHYLLAEKMKAETIQLIYSILPFDIKVRDEVSTVQKPTDSKPLGQNQTTCFISFKPNENIFANGTNPLYLIDELNALGECKMQVFFDRLPELSQVDPAKCYTFWEMFIATYEEIETLHDVFIFVNDLSEIEIEKVADGNVVHNELILADFLKARHNQEIWTPMIMTQPDIEESNEIFQGQEQPADINLSTEVSKMTATTTTNNVVNSIRVDSQKIDQYMNLVSELITVQSRLDLLVSKIHNSDLEIVTEAFEKISRQLRDNAFDMSLIPLSSIDVRFKRLIHDLS